MSERREALIWTDEGTGRDPDRPDFDRLCRKVEQRDGPPPAIAVSSLDRLYRNRADRDRIDCLLEQGVDIFSSREQIDTEQPGGLDRYRHLADWLMLAYEGEGVPAATTRLELMDSYLDRLGRWLQIMGATSVESEAALADVRARLIALASAWDDEELRVPLLAPWFELAIQHEPRELPLEIRALTLAGVRSTELESLHLSGHITEADWRPITQAAAFMFVGFPDASAPGRPDSDPFAGLIDNHPHAAAGFRALAAIRPGGRVDYPVPDGPAPALPAGEHAAEFTPAGHEVMHATDSRITHRGAEVIRQCVEERRPMRTPSLKHLSRNPAKLFRIVDILLGHGVQLVTSNLLITPGHVAWRERTGNYNELDVGWTGLRNERPTKQMRPGRNDPCPCGSGEKFKRCCGAR
jgi:hypothetical protein